jgi:hypothetical protein
VRSAFESSVPARKPKTQIGRVLTELTAQPPAPTDAVEDDPAGASAHNGADSSAAVLAFETPPPRASEPGATPRDARRVPDTAAVSSEWDRLAALRKRLELAAQPPALGTEPRNTAAAVRKHIEELRTRLEDALRERLDLARTLETTRNALARAEAELERERKTRSHMEAQANERQQVALQAVAEAEALAGERDLVLGELAERRRLQSEESVLLSDAEAALNRHRAANESVARELADARELLDLRATEIAELESRLESEAAERARVEARCRELEADIARFAETADALAVIREMVTPRITT